MSSGDEFTVQILTQLAHAANGALLGIASAYVAGRLLVKYATTASALRMIRAAPSASVSDLRSLLIDGPGGGSKAVLVLVRGTVEAKAAIEQTWKNLWPGRGVLSSKGSADGAVIVRRTVSCVYHEWNRYLPLIFDPKSIISRLWREDSSYTRTVPFVLSDSSHFDHVLVQLEGSNHPLPLVKAFHRLYPVSDSPFAFIQVLFQEYPIGLLDEETILPVGKLVTAVGMCNLKDGGLEIKSCQNLPYFLTELSKDEMVVQLSHRAKLLLWSGIIIGTVSLGILGFSIIRNWSNWKEWMQERRRAHEEEVLLEQEQATQVDPIEIPEGDLCVVCLQRRSQTAFVPCGHKVCCQRCARSLVRSRRSNCPVCRQSIRSSLRIYGS